MKHFGLRIADCGLVLASCFFVSCASADQAFRARVESVELTSRFSTDSKDFGAKVTFRDLQARRIAADNK